MKELCAKEWREKELCVRKLCVCERVAYECERVVCVTKLCMDKAASRGKAPQASQATRLRAGRDFQQSQQCELTGQCRKCRAYHTKAAWMSPSATPATQMARQCHEGEMCVCVKDCVAKDCVRHS